MSTEASPPQKPGLFQRIVSWPWRLSLAARASWATFLFLLILVAVTWILFFTDDTSVPWWQSMSWGRMVAILALVIAIPVVVYYSLRLWLEGEKSQFPDIDFAWKAGLDALAQNGISIHNTPVFLVLGSAGEQQERALLGAAGLRMRVEQVPEGPAPLHWSASPEAIFLFCTETSWLSGQSAIKEKYQREQGGASFPLLQYSESLGPMDEPEESVDEVSGGGPAAGGGSPLGGSASSRGTIMLDQFVRQESGPARRGAGQPGAGQPGTGQAGMGQAGMGQAGTGTPPRGTLVLNSPVQRSEAPVLPERTATGSGAVARSPSVAGRIAQVPAHESAERLQQLSYVCQLLRRARAPVCPINGVLALVPFSLVQSSPREAEETERAAKSDLLAIQRELQLRCPVVLLITGMEREAGFRELVRRVGRDPATTQRFGKGYDTRCQATPHEMNSLSAHVCGAFEDWVYTLFRERGALTRPGNTRLYGLLCKVRCTLKTRLAEVLGRGFGFDKQQTPADEPFLFSGCYFAATGETPDRRAFVRGVIDKLVDEQELVEWTQQALDDELRYRRWAIAGIAVSGLLLATLIGTVVYNRLT